MRILAPLIAFVVLFLFYMISIVISRAIGSNFYDESEYDQRETKEKVRRFFKIITPYPIINFIAPILLGIIWVFSKIFGGLINYIRQTFNESSHEYKSFIEEKKVGSKTRKGKIESIYKPWYKFWLS